MDRSGGSSSTRNHFAGVNFSSLFAFLFSTSLSRMAMIYHIVPKIDVAVLHDTVCRRVV